MAISLVARPLYTKGDVHEMHEIALSSPTPIHSLFLTAYANRKISLCRSKFKDDSKEISRERAPVTLGNTDET